MSKLFGFLNVVSITAFCSCEPAKKPEIPIEQKPKLQVVEVKKKMTELEYYADLIAKYKFENYPNEECKAIKTPAKPDVSDFRTISKEIIKKIKSKYTEDAPDFNCKYKIVQWYCGSPCQQNAVFDIQTGRLIDIIDSSIGVEYQLNSRMLIVNPADDSPIDTAFRTFLGPPVYWEMKNGKLNKLK